MSKLKLGELFAGYGGLGLAVEEVFGAELAWYAEFDAAPSKIMAHHWPHLTDYGDVTAVDWASVPPVDIISGGSPCQDLSMAGARKGMSDGTRSNLWESMREAIAVIQPRYVVWENVRGALSATATSDSDMEQREGFLGGRTGYLRALGRVLGDLAELGYDCQWRGLRAADVGAPHGRYRIFILATRRGHIQDAAGFGSESEHDCHQCGEESGRATRVADGPSDRPGGPAPIATNAYDPGRGEQRRTVATEAEQLSAEHASHATTDPSGAAEWEHPGEPSTEETGPGSRDGSSDHGGKRPDQERGEADANAASDGRNEGRAESAGEQGRHDATERGSSTDWGPYAPAIARWEAVRGTAPAPTELTPKGKHRLSARFAEWMMGVDPGWITGVPGISRNEQLKAAGNGVVPQQAAAAIRHMLNQ